MLSCLAPRPISLPATLNQQAWSLGGRTARPLTRAGCLSEVTAPTWLAQVPLLLSQAAPRTR